ncbi:Puromycin-sensitive aminopeptidase [Linum perenne]
MDAPKEVFLKDYKLPDYYFDTVDLSFLLGEEKTIVNSKIAVSPRVEGSSYPLVLNGHDLKLISVKINGNSLKEADYQLDSRHLTILSPPSGAFTLEISTEIYPQKNTSLEGLYKSSGNFCTQCEAEGFRNITFFQDRPDIMAKYTCRIEADKSLYPVLLSNGNLLQEGELEGGKHYALWEDPFKKPCYLFALVAGPLESRDDTFVTRSGRNVQLRIWTPAQDLSKTAHAMYSLKAAMKWDEEVFEPVPKETEEAKMDAPKEVFLKDYKLPDYYFDTVDLSFLLGEEKTIVNSKIAVSPRVEGSSYPLVLNGHDLKLISVKINGNSLKEADYQLDSRHLTILSPPSGAFTLEISTEIYPQKNTSLEGLYKSSGNFCTQCEAEGFRNITFFQDRPDIMAKYTCRIEADKSLYPVLLSNGNLLQEGELEGGKHYALWEDPFKKPCYLFALVAGPLESRDDTFVTRSGRNVQLRIWTPAQDLSKTAHAMYSLKAAMKWDEEVFGLEYDLDLFNIVVVPDFNLVTCRDWFQLSLKEGLTVFRDQEFSSDMGSRTVKRIGDVARLRNSQFPQDAGPMAHPVRPHSYIKVYEKGAEVVRMYKTLLGTQGFRKGMDLYFKRHDGQAVTCEDFFAAMRDANGADFANFLLWYSQAGTPTVKVASSYNAEAKTFSLKFSQEVPPTPGQPIKEPMFVPVALGLLDSSGKDLPLTSVYHDEKLQSIASDGQPAYTTVLRVTKKEEEFIFNDITEKPVPSLLRAYSAPIRLVSDLSDDDLFFLLAHDSDEFNRWEAGQLLARKLMLSLVADFQQNKPLVLNPKFVQGLRSILSDSSLDKEFIARAITLPGEGEIMDMLEVADPDAVHSVRSFIRKQLATELRADLLNTVKNNKSSEAYEFNHPNMVRRALKNVALAYLVSLQDEELTELALNEYKSATNMTDQFSALAALAQNPGQTRDEVLADFYNKWQDNYLVHSLIRGFGGSPVNFHAKDGSGYKFLGEIVVQLDKINPQVRHIPPSFFPASFLNSFLPDEVASNVSWSDSQVASRMVTAFSRWKRYDETRQNLAKAQLETIMSANGLSENVFEIASKSLAV